jgi:hypothetical protein
MRNWVIVVATLLLAGCGGETYPLPIDKAYSALTEVGTPAGLSPLPGVLSQVQVSFQILPDQKAVQWIFTHEGDDLGRLVATAKPNGDTASSVTVDYVQGAAPDESWHNAQVRDQLKSSIRELVVEAVDSSLEHRPFDMALHDRVEIQVTTATIGSTMMDVGNRVMAESRAGDDYENDPVTLERRRRLQEQATETRLHDIQVSQARRTQ